jgi:hypothetical protein
MSFKTQLTKDETAVEPEICREGDAVAFKVIVSGVVNGITSPTMTMYKEGNVTDVSGTYLTGSMSVSGTDTILTKSTTGLKQGNWILSVSATVDGQVQNVATIPLIVKRKGER